MKRDNLVIEKPSLITEWDKAKNGDLLPEQVSSGSHTVAWWTCQRGHSWQAVVKSRALQGDNCPYCFGKRPIVGETDLATIHPEWIAEWDYDKNIILPTQITAFSHKLIWWHCKKENHPFEARPLDRHYKNCGCPYCSGNRAIKGVNDLQTVLPHLADEWDRERNDLTPDSVKPRSMQRVWWVCKNGHHWLSTIDSRYNGNNCPYCFGKIQMKTRLVK